MASQCPAQALVAAGIAEFGYFGQEFSGVQVRVVAEPATAVVEERGEGVCPAGPGSGDAVAAEVRIDRGLAALQVPGDR
jgi:hypothetical protein